MITNNVTRLLDSKKIRYTSFELPKEKLGAEETAEFLNISSALVYKTIVVVRSNKKPLLCVIPGDRAVDLKAVAELIREKKVSIPSQNEAETLTGLQAGGISPLALLHKGFQTLIDQSALDVDEIHLSGGQRGLILRMDPHDLQNLTNAQFGIISKEKK